MSLPNHKARFVLAVGFLVIISVMSVANRKLLKSPVKKLIHGEAGFRQTTEAIASAYSSDRLKYKNSFINLNGFFARICGRRKCNDVLLLKDNLLSFDDDKFFILRWFQLIDFLNFQLAFSCHTSEMFLF